MLMGLNPKHKPILVSQWQLWSQSVALGRKSSPVALFTTIAAGSCYDCSPLPLDSFPDFMITGPSAFPMLPYWHVLFHLAYFHSAFVYFQVLLLHYLLQAIEASEVDLISFCFPHTHFPMPALLCLSIVLAIMKSKGCNVPLLLKQYKLPCIPPVTHQVSYDAVTIQILIHILLNQGGKSLLRFLFNYRIALKLRVISKMASGAESSFIKGHQQCIPSCINWQFNRVHTKNCKHFSKTKVDHALCKRDALSLTYPC